MIRSPVKTFGSSSIVIDDEIFLVGGYSAESGQKFNVISCSQILHKKFGSHAILTTETMSYSSIPLAKQTIHKYSILKDNWTESLIPPMPTNISDAALIVFENKLFVIGGFSLIFDGAMHVLEPQSSVWILDLTTNHWERGPDLPSAEAENLPTCRGYGRGSAYIVNQDLENNLSSVGKEPEARRNNKIILFSGGVQLTKTLAHESNQVFFFGGLHTNPFVRTLDLFFICFVHINLV